MFQSGGGGWKHFCPFSVDKKQKTKMATEFTADHCKRDGFFFATSMLQRAHGGVNITGSWRVPTEQPLNWRLDSRAAVAVTSEVRNAVLRFAQSSGGSAEVWAGSVWACGCRSREKRRTKKVRGRRKQTAKGGDHLQQKAETNEPHLTVRRYRIVTCKTSSNTWEPE